MIMLKKEQTEFYRTKKAGCIFAAFVAKNPSKYGWHQEIVDADTGQVNSIIEQAIDNQSISTLSLIFPSIQNATDLVALIDQVVKSNLIFIEQDVLFEGYRCLGLRVQINESKSWVSGFGPFEFLPKTRQSPFTELTFRVKPRPDYKWFMKPPISGVIHLADMDMKGLQKRTFTKWWNASIKNTKKILGHSPNLKSAAKTTYAIPESYCS